jgi:hypothetical protein
LPAVRDSIRQQFVIRSNQHDLVAGRIVQKSTLTLSPAEMTYSRATGRALMPKYFEFVADLQRVTDKPRSSVARSGHAPRPLRR